MVVDCSRQSCSDSERRMMWMMKIECSLIEIAALMMMMFEVIAAVMVEEETMTMVAMMMHCRCRCRWHFCCFYDSRRMSGKWYRNFECRKREVWDSVNGSLMLNECHHDLSNCLIIDHQIIDAETTEEEIYFHRRLIFPRLREEEEKKSFLFIFEQLWVSDRQHKKKKSGWVGKRTRKKKVNFINYVLLAAETLPIFPTMT